MSQTNYVPQIAALTMLPLDQFATNKSGVGSPEGVVTAFPGQTYVNTSNGNLYVFNGVAAANTGWVLITSGGGGSGATLSGSGAPNGLITGSPGNTYLNTVTNNFYVKATGTASNTGWIALITN